MGKAYAENGELESAIGDFERAAAAAAEAGDSLEEMRCEIWLASANIDSGNFVRDEELLGDALARTPATVDPAQRARIYWSQSRLHTLKGNQDAAARYARKTLVLLELGEDVYNTARAHQLLAFIAVERGRGEEALDWVGRGLTMLAGDPGPIETTQFRIEEARALVLLGRSEEAAATYIGDVYERLGALLEEEGRIGEALQMLKRAYAARQHTGAH